MRQVVFKALVGSNNYNLQMEESDKDYKIFVLPEFDDLYYNKIYSKSIIGEVEDLDYHDIRKVITLFWKSNINFIETLYSKDVWISLNPNICEIVKEIFSLRSEIVTMNLPHLFSACHGMHLEKMSQLLKGTEGTQHLVDKFGYDCYSEDTKFLTNNGWKFYDEVSENDLLATVNPLTHSLEYQKYYDRIKKKFNGNMYEMDNVFTNCKVTGNHRMYISPIVNRNKYGMKYREDVSNWKYESIENLINDKRSYYHVLTCPKNNNQNFGISDDLLKVIGCFVSEGTINFRDGKPKSTRITQTEKGKTEFFEVMDNIESFGFKKYCYAKETIWISHDKELVNFLYNNCKHKSENKRLPRLISMLSKSQAEILLNCLYLGDGTVKRIEDKKYGVVYCTINKQLAEDVQELALLCEKDSLLWGRENGYQSISNLNGNDLFTFQVYIKDKESIPKTMIFKPHSQIGNSSCSKGIEQREYNGNIVCFSVPNENLITQRSGKIAIQGNTKQATHAFRVLDFPQRFANSQFKDFEGAMKYSDVEREFVLKIKNGFYALDEFKEMIATAYKKFKEYEVVYKSQIPNEEVKLWLEEKVYEMVKDSLTQV